MTPLEEALIVRIRELEKLVESMQTPIYTSLEEAIYHNGKNKAEHKPHYTDEQIGKRLGVSAKTIQRTRNSMREQGKLT